MKKIRRIVFAVCCMLVFAACDTNQNLKEVTIDQRLLKVSGNTAEEFMEEIDAVAQVEKSKKNADGSLTLYLQETELEKWKYQEQSELQELSEELQQENKRFMLQWTEDERCVSLFYNQTVEKVQEISWIQAAEFHAALLQILNGSKEDWYVEVNIYNADSGKLVTTGNSKENLSYYDSDWESTYSDDWRDDYPENTVFLSFSPEVLTCFGLDRYKLAAFLSSYQEYLLEIVPDEQAVTIAVNPDQMDALIQYNYGLIEAEKQSFAAIYDGYRVEYGTDSSEIELWYDSRIQDEDIATEAVEIFLLSVMNQCFRNRDGSSWKIHILIYNQESGRLYEDETIPGEDLYIIGQNGW